MNFASTITEVYARHLADRRDPDIAGFVDQLIRVAAETGAVGGAYDGDKRLRFFVAPRSTPAQPTCLVEHPAARPILRMICARLAVLCKERTLTDVSPYGDQAVFNFGTLDPQRWSVSFVNTPDRQEFLIEAG